MFARSVVETDHFLDMPSSARVLYFHLGMITDDEGFIASPKSAIRAVGASAEDLALLISQRYLIQFESGVCVMRHWLINNQLQKDRARDTTCTKEKKCLLIEKGEPYELLTDGATTTHSA